MHIPSLDLMLARDEAERRVHEAAQEQLVREARREQAHQKRLAREARREQARQERADRLRREQGAQPGIFGWLRQLLG
jgi:hypothetical protein